MWDFMKDKEDEPQEGVAGGFRRMLVGKDSEDISRGHNRLKSRSLYCSF